MICRILYTIYHNYFLINHDHNLLDVFSQIILASNNMSPLIIDHIKTYVIFKASFKSMNLQINYNKNIVEQVKILNGSIYKNVQEFIL